MRASLTSGLLIGADVRSASTPADRRANLRDRPAGPHPALRRRASAANRAANGLEGEQGFLAGMPKSAKRIGNEPSKELLQHHLAQCPLIAIIRGVTPDEVEAVGDAI